MKKCNKCKIQITTDHKLCPLCFDVLETVDDSIETINEKDEVYFPEYNYQRPKYNVFFRIITFLTILGSLASILVNILTYKETPQLWSIIVIIGLIYVWVLLKSTFKARSKVASKLVVQMVALSILTLTVDLVFDYDKWSINYVIPFLSMASLITIAILLITNGVRFGEYAPYLLSSIFLGLIPFILWLFKLVTVLWPSLAAISLSIATMVGMFVFYDRNAKEEFKKRFHI